MVWGDKGTCMLCRLSLSLNCYGIMLTIGTTSPPPSNLGIDVTMSSSGDVQVTCPGPLNCLALFQSSKSFLQLRVGFINSSTTSIVVSLDSDDDYVVVYSWDSEESIFNGIVSFTTQLYSPTSKCMCLHECACV